MLDLLMTKEPQFASKFPYLAYLAYLPSYLGRDLILRRDLIVREVARVLLFSCCLHIAGLVLVPVA